MSNTALSVLMLMSCLTLTNFIYQAITRQDNWWQALETSFLQAVAILIFVVVFNARVA